MRVIFPGRHKIWWTLVAPCNVTGVSYVTRINHESHFFVAGALLGEVGGWTPVAPCSVNNVFHICDEDQS